MTSYLCGFLYKAHLYCSTAAVDPPSVKNNPQASSGPPSPSIGADIIMETGYYVRHVGFIIAVFGIQVIRLWQFTVVCYV